MPRQWAAVKIAFFATKVPVQPERSLLTKTTALFSSVSIPPRIFKCDRSSGGTHPHSVIPEIAIALIQEFIVPPVFKNETRFYRWRLQKTKESLLFAVICAT
jgi:hypothetical protein